MHIAYRLLVAALLIISLLAVVVQLHFVFTASPNPLFSAQDNLVSSAKSQTECGPRAHVQQHPKYGSLCIQNKGSWRVSKQDGLGRDRFELNGPL